MLESRDWERHIIFDFGATSESRILPIAKNVPAIAAGDTVVVKRKRYKACNTVSFYDFDAYRHVLLITLKEAPE